MKKEKEKRIIARFSCHSQENPSQRGKIRKHQRLHCKGNSFLIIMKNLPPLFLPGGVTPAYTACLTLNLPTLFSNESIQSIHLLQRQIDLSTQPLHLLHQVADTTRHLSLFILEHFISLLHRLCHALHYDWFGLELLGVHCEVISHAIYNVTVVAVVVAYIERSGCAWDVMCIGGWRYRWSVPEYPIAQLKAQNVVHTFSLLTAVLQMTIHIPRP